MKMILLIIAGSLTITGYISLFRDKLVISTVCFILVIGVWICSITCSPSDNTKETPTALDVYCGKTTLEITYRDSVAVDSVVVYKMK